MKSLSIANLKDVDAIVAFLRRAGVAVEPQTAYANAFNTGNDLIVKN